MTEYEPSFTTEYNDQITEHKHTLLTESDVLMTEYERSFTTKCKAKVTENQHTFVTQSEAQMTEHEHFSRLSLNVR